MYKNNIDFDFFEKEGFLNKQEKKNFINSQKFQKYKTLARNSKNEEDFERYMSKAKKYLNIGDDDFVRFYIRNKRFKEAEKELNKIIDRRKKLAKKDGYIYNLQDDTYTYQLYNYFKEQKNKQ